MKKSKEDHIENKMEEPQVPYNMRTFSSQEEAE